MPSPSDLLTLQKRARSIGLEKVMLIARKPPQGDFRDFVWGGVVF